MRQKKSFAIRQGHDLRRGLNIPDLESALVGYDLLTPGKRLGSLSIVIFPRYPCDLRL